MSIVVSVLHLSPDIYHISAENELNSIGTKRICNVSGTSTKKITLQGCSIVEPSTQRYLNCDKKAKLIMRVA